MSFDSTLRKRSSLHPLISVLTDVNGLNLKENNLGAYDMEIEIENSEWAATTLKAGKPHRVSEAQDSGEAPSRVSPVLRLLIITPSMMLQELRPATCERLDHFNHLTGGVCSAVIFFLDRADIPDSIVTPELCYADLQFAMQSHDLEMPCLLLTAATAFPKFIGRFGKELTKNYDGMIPTPNAALDIAKYCTADGTMDEETFIAVTDGFPNMEELAGIETGEEGVQRLIDAGASPTRAEAAAKFWDEEFIAE